MAAGASLGGAEAGGPAIVLDVGASAPQPRVALQLDAVHGQRDVTVTDLGEVAALLEQALQEQLTTALDGALGPLGDAIDQAAVVDEALATLGVADPYLIRED